jgi:glycogen synthase
MNILIITHTYPDKKNIWNGIFYQEQARALRQRHNVFVISSQVDYEIFHPFFNYRLTKSKENNLTEYNIYVTRSFPIYNQFNYFITSFFLIKKLLKKTKIDIIHCHNAFPSGIMGFLLSKYYNVPYVITEHASNFKNRFRTFIHRKLVLKALNNAGEIIAVGESLKQEINQYTSKSIKIVPNVIDISKLRQGIYVCELVSDNSRIREKLIVK